MILCLLLGALLCGTRAQAQHTLGVTGGYGFGNGRLYPEQENKSIWGCYTGGVTWRFYGPQRFVGGFGIDLEYLQRGFSFATNASMAMTPADYKWYTRRVNSLMLPIVWQPHAYLFKNRMRVYVEAAVFFSYNISSSYINEEASSGSSEKEYQFKLARDNRWGYGLAGGGGISVLVKRMEINLRVRYYFGYSDILRNRNKYANNATDGGENPFRDTPLRSPLDNLTFSIGISYRFNKKGFTEWEHRPAKRSKNKEVFDYKSVK